MPTAKDLEHYLKANIPITDAMGIRVDLATPQKVILSAPYANNINHQKSVFGGSLHAVATLSCWNMLHLLLYDTSVNIVIASSEIKYLSPVNADFQAECEAPLPQDWDKFLKGLSSKGKARLKLHAKIFHLHKLCVDYSGMFVAMK